MMITPHYISHILHPESDKVRDLIGNAKWRDVRKGEARSVEASLTGGELSATAMSWSNLFFQTSIDQRKK